MTNRDHDLRQHYENKDLLIFVNGLDWFITQTNAIHTKHGSLNPDDDRSEWDLANGYYIGNYGPPAVETVETNRITRASLELVNGYKNPPRR